MGSIARRAGTMGARGRGSSGGRKSGSAAVTANLVGKPLPAT